MSTYDIEEVKTDKYLIKQGDSFELIKELIDESIGGSFFSPPFHSLFTFSDSHNDLSNCKSYEQFFEHFDFMPPDLMRVLKPGRMIGIHLTQLTTGIGKDGYYSTIDFRGDIIRLFQKHGFIFHGDVTIWKSPELAAVRTKNHQLLHKTTKRDCLVVRPGLADYLVLMRKPGINKEPVNFEGQGLPFERWCEIASPVWMDIRESNVLKYRKGRDEEDVKHITPTQLEVIKRFYLLYTNPKDTVYSPFSGVGSDIVEAVKLDRYGIGHELKESYFSEMKKNLASLELEQTQTELFA